LINAYLSVHSQESSVSADRPLPHILLTDSQALWVSWNGYELIEG